MRGALNAFTNGGRDDGADDAVAAYSGGGGACVRGELGDSHGVAVAQERLPEDAARKRSVGRAASVLDSARRLFRAAPLGQRGASIARVRRPRGEGTGVGDDGLSMAAALVV